MSVDPESVVSSFLRTLVRSDPLTHFGSLGPEVLGWCPTNRVNWIPFLLIRFQGFGRISVFSRRLS